MAIKSSLETACIEILGDQFEQYYRLLSNLLLLNVNIIRKNDERLSAKITAILFDDNITNKPNIICEYIEAADWKFNFKTSELGDTKKLLELDPELETTSKIIKRLKELPNQNYSEIMRKVNIIHELKLYRNRDGYTRTRI